MQSTMQSTMQCTCVMQVGAEPNAQRTDGLTATMAAASQSDPALVMALLAAGGDANAKDTRGVTARHLQLQPWARTVAVLAAWQCVV